jgi:hypothetical protein
MNKKPKTDTFQDELFELFQLFWKGGYAYRHNKDKNEHLFYTSMLEDLMLLSREEFISKYKFYEN